MFEDGNRASEHLQDNCAVYRNVRKMDVSVPIGNVDSFGVVSVIGYAYLCIGKEPSVSDTEEQYENIDS